jgi:hypothetical protein
MKRMCAGLAVLVGVMALGASPIAQSQTTTDIVGSWDITTVSPIGENTNNMVISKDGESLKAVVKGDAGELPYDKIALKGSDVTIVLTIDYQGSPMVITYTGAVEGKKMGGDCDFGGLAQGSWSAVRK